MNGPYRQLASVLLAAVPILLLPRVAPAQPVPPRPTGLKVTCQHKLFAEAAEEFPDPTTNVRLFGTVTDSATKAPVAGATITAKCRGQTATAVSAANGTYQVVVQLYRNNIQKPQQCDFQLKSGTASLAVRWSIDGGSDGTATATAQYPVPANARDVVIRGQVLTADGKKADGATVLASAGAQKDTAKTDRNGLFAVTLRVNPRGTAQVAVPNVQTFRLDRRPGGTVGPDTAALPVTLVCEHQAYTAAKEALTAPAGIGSVRISGVVTDSRSSAPVPGAVVTATCGGKSFRDTSDQAGKYEVVVVISRNPTQRPETRNFRLVSGISSLAVRWQIDGGDLGAATVAAEYPIPASARDLVIQGQVLTHDGKKVTGATVLASSGGQKDTAKTDLNGLFNVKLTVNPRGAGQAAVPKVQVFRLVPRPDTAAEPVTLVCTHEAYKAVADKRPGVPGIGRLRISGTVSDARQNTPVSGAVITATCGGKSFRATTDPAGRYELLVTVGRGMAQKVETCNFRLLGDLASVGVRWRIEAGEFGSAELTAQYPVPADAKMLVIRGQVLTHDGRKVTGASVEAVSGGRKDTAKSDREGLFSVTLPANPGGTGQAALPKVQEFRLERPPDTTAPPVTLTCVHKVYPLVTEKRPGARGVGSIRISGIVTDARLNVPVPAAVVTATCEGKSGRGISDAAGRYEVVVTLSRLPGERRERCDFRLTSETVALTVQWAIEAGEYAGVLVSEYRIPGSIVTLVIPGQVLTDDGRVLAGATVQATWNHNTYTARTDRDGRFALTGVYTKHGAGQMTLAEMQTFRLRRKTVPAELPVRLACQHKLYPAVAAERVGDGEAGSIRVVGTVTDARLNVPVPGAVITATYGGKTFRGVSDANGAYQVVVVLRPGARQRTEQCDFRLQSGLRTLTVDWYAQAGPYAAQARGQYIVPANLRELVVRGQMLTDDGKVLPGAVVRAALGRKAFAAKADENGMFSLAATCNEDGVGQLVLPKAEVFRLARWQEELPGSIGPQELTEENKALDRYGLVARAARTQLPPKLVAKLEKFLGAEGVHDAVAAGPGAPRLDPKTAERILQALYYGISDDQYVAARKVLGMPAAGGFGTSDDTRQYLDALRGIFQKAYPRQIIGTTLPEAVSGFTDQIKAWLGVP